MSRSGAPGLVPCRAAINGSVWRKHRDRLLRLKDECPDVALGDPPTGEGPRDIPHTKRDDWGCLWRYPGMGLDGQVIEHPLVEWDALADWEPPSSATRVDEVHAAAAKRRAEGKGPAAGGTEHGFLFLRLTYLRGFENFMIDVALDDPRIYGLRETVAAYWHDLIAAHLDCGATWIGAADDLGLQDRLPLSPEMWRRFLKPAFARAYAPTRERGVALRMHTDGYIVEIIPDLIEIGVTHLNAQDLVNGLENLERLAKGRCQIDLDLDRQRITAFGTPDEIDAHVKRCIETLGSPEGGLTVVWGVYPGTPIENIEATVRAMQNHRTIWAG